MGPDNDSALPGAAPPRDELFRLVYDDLRRMAAIEMNDQRRQVTFQPTALVHEAYLRLFGGPERTFESRAHFFRTAAKAMRSILVDAARARSTAKRGGGETLVALVGDAAAEEASAYEALAVDEALERLDRIDPRGSRVVELRFFCGLEMEEIAAILGANVRTVYRDWETARTWLYRELAR